MHLTPHEQERLLIHVAADVAQRRRERGLLLNYPEVMALLSAHVYEEARAGATVDSIMESGRHVLTRRHVMAGVPEMIDSIQIEATFPDGTKMVTIHDPFEKLAEDEQRNEDEQEKLPVYPGKVDLVPEPEAEQTCGRQEHRGGSTGYPPQYIVEFNKGASAKRMCVKNKADRPIQVGSHFHFYEANAGYKDQGALHSGLEFDRAEAYGMRLNIPAGTSERFEPGDERWVSLVPIQGEKKVKGLQGDGLQSDREIDEQPPIRDTDGKLNKPPTAGTRTAPAPTGGTPQTPVGDSTSPAQGTANNDGNEGE